MAQEIPGVTSGVAQYSENIPGVQFPYRQEFGKVGQATEHIGEAVEGAAHTGSEIYDEIQKQHDISTASQNAVDAGVSHAQQLQNLKLTSPDGFMHEDDTGDIVKNSDGTQRTIAQEYWDWADDDYQTRQKNMSPRAAAMFRQQMQPEIGTNTKLLQNEQLSLQRRSSDQALSDSMATLARDNDRSPWSDQRPYYSSPREDGTINLRGNTDKINDQLRTIKLWTSRQGPSDGTPGMYNPAEVDKLSQARLSDHSNDWVRSAVTDIMENDTPRDHKNRVSTTAVQQVLNLRDVIEGKDPQSMAASSKGLPTVNSSLTAEQSDKWRSQLNSMLDGAKQIDKSDYELQLEQMKAATKSGKYGTMDTLVKSPEFGYLVHAAEPLGMTPEKTMKDMSEIFGNAAKSAGHNGVSDLSSNATKSAQISQNLRSFELGFPQYSTMLGVKFSGAMSNAIIGEAGKSAYSQLAEEDKQYREDPAKFAAQIASGPQDPDKGIKYRSNTMKAVEDQLYSDPSPFAPLKSGPGGKPVIVSAIKEMKRVGSVGFGQGYDVNYLSKDDYKSWANKLSNSGNPEQVEQVFQQLRKVAPQDASAVMDQLTKYGDLDPRYQIAQNLPTSSARIAAYSDIMSKGASIEAYTKSEGGEPAGDIWKKAQKSNQDVIDFSNRVYGADSPEASKATHALNQTWASAYASAMGVKGTSQSDAARAADERVKGMIAPVATVQDQHHFLGFAFGSAGPASKVQFTRPDLSEDQKATIQRNLLKAQQLQALQPHEVVPAPIQPGAYDFNKKLTPEWIAQHPFAWRPVRGGGPTAAYRLQYQGMNADGSPNGRGYDLKTYDSHGFPTYYEVRESDALKAQAK